MVFGEIRRISFVLIVFVLLGVNVLGLDNENVSSSVSLTGNIPTSTIEVNDVGGEGDELIPLEPNATKLVSCWGVASDTDGNSDMVDVDAWLFIPSLSYRNDTLNESQNYRNFSCDISNLGTSGEWNCTFNVQYFALNETWNCSVNITNTDSAFYNDSISDTAIVEELLALNVENTTIDFGTRAVDFAYDADVPVVVHNEGNVGLDLQVDAWEQNATLGQEINSASAFNCSIGTIPITSLVFNESQTTTFAESLPLVQTGTTGVIDFDLAAQVGGSGSTLPTFSNTYWGIEVPGGNAGTCTGYIQYIAVRN